MKLVSVLTPEFLLNEPMCTALDIDAVRDAKLFVDTTFLPYVKDGVSVVAVDSATRIMVGFRYATIVRKDVPDLLHFSKDDPNTRCIALTFEFISGLYKDLDLYANYNVDKYVHFRGLLVTEKYQRQGIASKMVQKTLELSRERNIGLVTVEASSSFSAKIFENLGFEKLMEQSYDSVKVDDKPLRMTDEVKYHKRIAVYVKIL